MRVINKQQNPKLFTAWWQFVKQHNLEIRNGIQYYGCANCPYHKFNTNLCKAFIQLQENVMINATPYIKEDYI